MELWRDMRDLQEAGAFALVSREHLLAELCRTLLRNGHFRLAKAYLQVRSLRLSHLFGSIVIVCRASRCHWLGLLGATVGAWS